MINEGGCIGNNEACFGVWLAQNSHWKKISIDRPSVLLRFLSFWQTAFQSRFQNGKPSWMSSYLEWMQHLSVWRSGKERFFELIFSLMQTNLARMIRIKNAPNVHAFKQNRLRWRIWYINPYKHVMTPNIYLGFLKNFTL